MVVVQKTKEQYLAEAKEKYLKWRETMLAGLGTLINTLKENEEPLAEKRRTFFKKELETLSTEIFNNLDKASYTYYEEQSGCSEEFRQKFTEWKNEIEVFDKEQKEKYPNYPDYHKK